MLTIKDLNKSFGGKQVLCNINLQLAPGMVHGIIGPNGAGKTTLFNCICAMLEYNGHISYTGNGHLKNYIGYVPTEPYFFPRTKGIEYLELIRHARGEKQIDKEVMTYFELPLNEYIENYSTGMKRKIAFMGAMIGRSEIYILDEPFNGVDIKSNLVLKRKILDLKQQGCTILLSSHIILSLAELCDKVYLLDGGTIARQYLPSDFNEIENDMMQL